MHEVPPLQNISVHAILYSRFVSPAARGGETSSSRIPSSVNSATDEKSGWDIPGYPSVLQHKIDPKIPSLNGHIPC